jgi:hypothetical protein
MPWQQSKLKEAGLLLMGQTSTSTARSHQSDHVPYVQARETRGKEKLKDFKAADEQKGRVSERRKLRVARLYILAAAFMQAILLNEAADEDRLVSAYESHIPLFGPVEEFIANT